ncbi:prephenate dehydratase domain-containing protein [Actinomyces wuliandei]|uniref:prephenate dehydratase domain-containing protein n=1 Tax=Actinomyces wuliandei TaxID=2057743 RepID=UPI00111ABC06|nr:prephenate dehydratase domain-containing protein [Actinomyces wuliandei]
MLYFTVNDYIPSSSIRVSTLGPSGTSSEQAAKHFLEHLGADNGQILLHLSYHDAAISVSNGEADYLVVANAFHGINDFYMDPTTDVHSVFHMLTPMYGLAKRPNISLPTQLEVISHPAPVALITELMPQGYECTRIIPANSTASAAKAVNRGDYDVALTTHPAAEQNNLRFFSNQRPIEMVWTVFTQHQERI